jgi:hypothetical protein
LLACGFAPCVDVGLEFFLLLFLPSSSPPLQPVGVTKPGTRDVLAKLVLPEISAADKGKYVRARTHATSKGPQQRSLCFTFPNSADRVKEAWKSSGKKEGYIL